MNILYSDQTSEPSVDVFYDAMSREPEGSSGMMIMQWDPPGAGGHVVNYRIENGQPIIYDAQCRERMDASVYASRCYELGYMRTDNLEPDWDMVRQVVE